METRVYMLDVSLSEYSEQEKSALLERILPELSAYRQEKVRQTRFLEDRLCSAGAGLLLNLGLESCGLSGREEPIGFCGNRKPYLVKHPELHFNLSHSGGMVMAAFSDRPVGCDIEKDGKADLRVARRFFHEAERADVERQPDPAAMTDRFYRYWTLKESFLKVTGEGMRLAMNRFCIHIPEAESSRITVKLDDALQPHDFKEWRLPGYHAALCVNRQEGEETPGDVFFSFQTLQDVV